MVILWSVMSALQCEDVLLCFNIAGDTVWRGKCGSVKHLSLKWGYSIVILKDIE
jgi:hypothetical protein